MKLPVWKILVIILLEGFVTISLEILAIRQLIPFVGNSVIVTGLIIGVFLLCLAYGYRAGGRQATNLLSRLKRNFFIALAGIGLGLSYTVINYFFTFAQGSLHIPLVYTLVIYLCLIIAPIVYFLGQTVPMTMHLLGEQKSAGSVGGRVLHLSTMGSFLGSVLTAVVLMSFLGVAWTIIINVLILSVLILLITEQRFQNLSSVLLALVVLGSGVYYINRVMEKQLFVKTTPYGNYSVIQGGQFGVPKGVKFFVINNSLSSAIDEAKQGGLYIEYIKNILFHQLKLQHKNILILGAGGFSLTAEGDFNNQITYVDIDPKISKIVREHFIKEINGKFLVADARQYVKHHPGMYDVIVSDTYSNVAVIPMHLLTLNYFKDLRAALKPGGLAVFNVIAPPFLNTQLSQRVDNTIRAAFGHCTVAPIFYTQNPNALSNLVYVCRKDSHDSRAIYTDDLNQSGLDMFNAKNLNHAEL